MHQIAKQIILTIVIICLISGCASFQSGKVNVENYPAIDQIKVKNLNLSYYQVPHDYKKNEKSLNYEVIKEFEKNDVLRSSLPSVSNSCSIEVVSIKTTPFQNLCAANYIVSFFTLFSFPLYCQHNFEAKATLKTPSGKILKEYQLNDRAHEVWSVLIPLLLPIPAVWDAQTEKGWGDEVVKRNIAQALTRQIIHDASNFKECQ